MKLTNLVIALATFATVTLSSAFYVSQQEVTSAVIVDKAKHSLNLTTNGLYNISLVEAYVVDMSEAEQINFLRCSFSRPEFRFSWYCHQLKIDGKMTKQSYVALKDDIAKHQKKDVVKSFGGWVKNNQKMAESLGFVISDEGKSKAAGVGTSNP